MAQMKALVLVAAVIGASALKLEMEATDPLRRARQTHKHIKAMYTEPGRPGCARAVEVEEGKIVIHGSDGNPGCVEAYTKGDKASLKEWTAEGVVLEDNFGAGEKMGLDFTGRGSTSYLEAQFTSEGLRFEDGKVWKETKIGEHSYSDPNHLGCMRTVDFNQGVVTVIGTDGADGGHCEQGRFNSQGEEWTVVGHQHGNSVFLDFSPKGGPKDLEATILSDGLLFSDGNKWTLIEEEDAAAEEEDNEENEQITEKVEEEEEERPVEAMGEGEEEKLAARRMRRTKTTDDEDLPDLSNEKPWLD